MRAVPLGPSPSANAGPGPRTWWRHGDRDVVPSPAVAPAGASSTDAWAEDLWNEHGQLVYSMACALLGDESAAMRAVAQGMVDFAHSGVVAPGDDTARALARHVYRRSTHLTVETPGSTGLPPAMVWLAQLAQLQRAALALCAFGGFTCTGAAELLRTTPTAVAQLLSSGLDELRRLSEPVVVI
jgi:hypothetical protein